MTAMTMRAFQSPHTVIEDMHSPACDEEDQQFAWDLLPGRQLGGALSFFHRELYNGAGKYEHTLLAAAPLAGSDSGRVMTYLRCRSCALFPKPDGETAVVGGHFGAALGVGFFSPGVERLVVGAPRLGGGQVAIVGDFARWDILADGGTNAGTRECQCDWDEYYPYNVDCAPWVETLQGSFGDDEEFGATLAIADLNCDGLDDLIVGAPGADLPTMEAPLLDAGAIYVYFNPGEDFSGVAPTILHQSSLEVGGQAQAGERFGAALTVGNFNGAQRVSNQRSCFDLVVGVPNENGGAGQVQVFEGSPGGLVYGGPLIDLDGIFGASADPGVGSGNSFMALAVGAPGENGDVGSVNVYRIASMGPK